jgi:uncharacterized protein YfiM (DUF2279 family)
MWQRFLILLWLLIYVFGIGEAEAQIKPDEIAWQVPKPKDSTLLPVCWVSALLDSTNNRAHPLARTHASSAALKAWALKQDFWFTRDKVQHFAACCFITYSSRLAATAILNFEKNAATVFAGGLATFIGFMREVVDDHEYNNIFSIKDMVADMLGVVVALVILAFI